MAVKIRLKRLGRRHRPFFRINAVDSRTPRDGRILERLGHYDPLEKDTAKQIVLDREKVESWLARGAVPTQTVSNILRRQGIKDKFAEQRAARREKAKAIARKKGRLFTETEKIAVQKAAEKQEAEAEAKQKAEEEAKKKAEQEAKQKAEAEEKKKAEAEAEQKAEAEAKEKAETPAEEKTETEQQAKPETEQKTQPQAEQQEAEQQQSEEEQPEQKESDSEEKPSA